MKLNKVCCHLTCVDGKSRMGVYKSSMRCRSGTTCFDQQAFVEAVGVAAATIAQASAAGS